MLEREREVMSEGGKAYGETARRGRNMEGRKEERK